MYEEGEYFNGQIHGNGTLQYPRLKDMCYYEGQFSHGIRSGRGKEVCIKDYQHKLGIAGEIQIRREFDLGHKSSHEFYEGFFVSNLYHGRGKIKYENDTMIHGYFDGGQLHGQAYVEEPRAGRRLLISMNQGDMEGRQLALGKDGVLLEYQWLDGKQSGEVTTLIRNTEIDNFLFSFKKNFEKEVLIGAPPIEK